jgi:Zn-dependent protease with chaperone function
MLAHISNNDRFAMDWATSLQRAIAITALAGLSGQRNGWGTGTALTALLRSAPSIGQLLYMALSRSRELDADDERARPDRPTACTRRRSQQARTVSCACTIGADTGHG